MGGREQVAQFPAAKFRICRASIRKTGNSHRHPSFLTAIPDEPHLSSPSPHVIVPISVRRNPRLHTSQSPPPNFVLPDSLRRLPRLRSGTFPILVLPDSDPVPTVGSREVATLDMSNPRPTGDAPLSTLRANVSGRLSFLSEAKNLPAVTYESRPPTRRSRPLTSSSLTPYVVFPDSDRGSPPSYRTPIRYPRWGAEAGTPDICNSRPTGDAPLSTLRANVSGRLSFLSEAKNLPAVTYESRYPPPETPRLRLEGVL